MTSTLLVIQCQLAAVGRHLLANIVQNGPSETRFPGALNRQAR